MRPPAQGHTPPPKWTPNGGCTPNAPGALQLHPRPFLRAEESQFPMGTLHQGAPRAPKNFGLCPVSATNWFGDGGQRFFLALVSMSMSPMCAVTPPPPRAPLLRMWCRKRRGNAQRRVMYVTSGFEKKGGHWESSHCQALPAPTGGSSYCAGWRT